MTVYAVCLSVDTDGSNSYQRKYSTMFASDAAECWAAWYCAFTGEYDSPFECFVRRADGDDWLRFEIEVIPMPEYRASEIT